MPWLLGTSKRKYVLASSGFIFLCLLTYGLLDTTVDPVPSDLENINMISKRELGRSTELRLVHVLTRHGSRTPVDTYPNDPHVNESFYPTGWGQLTNHGKRMIFQEGEWLRKRYQHFLGSTYQPDVVHAQSTGTSRTVMSLLLLLAGIWPPKGTPNEWNTNLNWQPIPVSSQPLDEDSLLLVRKPCPRYHELLEEVLGSEKVRQILMENKRMFDELTQHSGLNITNLDDVQSLYSTLRAEEDFGLKLPEWTRPYYPTKLQNLTELSYIFNIYTNELKQIKGGPFVQEMLKQYELNQNNPMHQTKMFLYTGHDSSVVNILSSLGVWEKQMPVYGIMALFEFRKHKMSQEFGLEIYLRNSSSHEPYPLTIPGCDFFCPLSRLISLTKSVMPTKTGKECVPFNPDFIAPELKGP